MVLMQIVLATLAGGVLSVLMAALISSTLLSKWLPRMVSFSVGTMLAAAFLELLPGAAGAGLGLEEVGVAMMGGILLFFIIEKLAIWRHAHAHEPGHGGHTIQVSGPMVLVGDGLHNFVDGILIAAAFLQGPEIGWAATLAVVAHEVPQEVGDTIVLVNAGYSRRKALFFNALSGLTAVIGGMLGYWLLSDAYAVVPYALALAAASFVYIAVADLIPNLHHGRAVGEAPGQVVLMILGMVVIAIGHLAHGAH